ncbi:MAG: hypothetical protein K8T90_18605 [Planctomycetes bacterium]|nr:hypothetical protein [Planctomycetota bacterium]
MIPERVPLVMVPRYSSLAGSIGGSAGFTSVPLDVTEYSLASLTVWRGVVIGPAPPPMTDAFEIVFEGSTDRVVWTTCAGSPVSGPGENVQVTYGIGLTRRWFRVRIKLAQPDNVVTCWVAGFLDKRLP